MTEKTELIGLNKEELQAALTAIGEKPFRAKQLWQWLYYFGETDFAKMSNISKTVEWLMIDKKILYAVVYADDTIICVVDTEEDAKLFVNKLRNDLKEIDELESKNKDELIKSGLYNLHDEGNDGPFYSRELCELFKKYSNELIAKEEYKYLAQLLDFKNLFYNHRFFEYKKIKYFGEME